MDKVRCPYCGAEMELDQTFKSMMMPGTSVMFWYSCDVCGAEAPSCNSKESAHAAAMQRFIAPDKQIKGVCADCMWCAESDKTNRIFCVFHGDEAEFETFADNWCPDFGRRPTAEENAANPWPEVTHD